VRAAVRCGLASPERAAAPTGHCRRRHAPERSFSEEGRRGLRSGRLASLDGGAGLRRERRPLGLHANSAHHHSMCQLGSQYGSSGHSSASPSRRRRPSRQAATRSSPPRAPSSWQRAATSAWACRRRPPRAPRPPASLRSPRCRRARLPRQGRCPTTRTAPPELTERVEWWTTQAVPPQEAAPTLAAKWMRAAPRVSGEGWRHLAAGAVRADRRRPRRRRPGFRDERRELRTQPRRTGLDRRSQRPPRPPHLCGRAASRDA
jgi:hypothetical protein